MALIAACSGDDLTGPSIVDDLGGRRIAVTAVNGKIAFDSDRDGNVEIYVMNADGTGQTRLTNNVAFDLQPAWSPDGTKIAFQSTRDGNPEIYVMNADGTGPTRLTNQSGSDLDAAWSPDGTKIAFERLPSFGTFDIYVMNADGTGQTNLTNNLAIDSDPAWSPDGTKIAFRSNRDGDFDIFVMNADGSGPVPLTDSSANDGDPDWGVAAGTLPTCAEGVSEARSRIAQLLPNRPFLRFLLNLLLTRMQSGAFPNAETNFGNLLDFLAQRGVVTAQDAAELKGLVAPC